MGFLRRFLGGPMGEDDRPDTTAEAAAGPAPPEADEEARERQLLRAEAERLDDDLIQRQLRYADRAWTPPAQGGTGRAEDGDRPAE